MLKAISNFLAKPTLLHFIFPLLMIYLFAGTIAQKYIGLYEATRIFFSSLFIWLGPIPLPGMPIVLGLIFLNLAFKLIFKSPWVWKNSGIIITHIGTMLLLIGGVFTALFSYEGYIDLSQGSRSAEVSDYHEREFVLLDENDNVVYSIAHSKLSSGSQIQIDLPQLSAQIIEACRNCKILPREHKDDSFQGMALHMQLQNAPPRNKNEENMAGLTFRVQAPGLDDKVYVALENVPRYSEVTVNNQTYRFALRKKIRSLPFDIELVRFERDMHPGTMMAKAYKSYVRVHDNGAQWESLIHMNAPLRYKGYSIYQSSFIQTPEGDISVLAVVWNAGRIFPYISGLVMCFGMLLHLYTRHNTKKGSE